MTIFAISHRIIAHLNFTPCTLLESKAMRLQPSELEEKPRNPIFIQCEFIIISYMEPFFHSTLSAKHPVRRYDKDWGVRTCEKLKSIQSYFPVLIENRLEWNVKNLINKYFLIFCSHQERRCSISDCVYSLLEGGRWMKRSLQRMLNSDS